MEKRVLFSSSQKKKFVVICVTKFLLYIYEMFIQIFSVQAQGASHG